MRKQYVNGIFSRVPKSKGRGRSFVFALLASACAFLFPGALAASQFGVEIDYLYWRADQTNMSYGIRSDAPTLGATTDLAPLQQDRDWSSAFRLGVAYSLPCSWGGELLWTRFHNSPFERFSKTLVIANQLLAPNFGDTVLGGDGVGGPVTSAWKLSFDMFDLNLGFLFLGDCTCRYSFFIGIKGGIIDQLQKIKYIDFIDSFNGNLVNATVNFDNDYWGVGVKAGFNSSYCIGCGFNLIGLFSLSALYGDLHSHNRTVIYDTDNLGDTELIVNDFDFTEAKCVPQFELFIGIDWSKALCGGYLAYIAVGYETQYFWNTWRTQNSTIQNLYVTNAGFGDLHFHGLTIKLAAGF